MKHVELDRNFTVLQKDEEPSADLARFWGKRYGNWISWSELLKYRRVVLLAEASSGKTEEFREQTKRLTSQGRAAFFVRIEELGDQGFEKSLEPGTVKVFEQWQKGGDEAWFFLDSVDEARLNHKSFDTALRNLAKSLDQGLDRSYIILSCRITDWKGDKDRAAITHYLPAREPPKPPEPGANPLLDPIFKEKSGNAIERQFEAEPKPYELTLVQLAPLVEEQYRALAKASGVKDVDAFAVGIHSKTLDAYAAPAKSGAELLRVVMDVLSNIQHDLTKGDVSSRPLLEKAPDEDPVQHWIAEQMNFRALGRFLTHREKEVAIRDKPDITVSSTSATLEVGIEVKHGGMGWTYKQLVDALKVQLAEDYLKPECRRQGVLVVTYHGNRTWIDPDTNEKLEFPALMAKLSAIAATISHNSSGAIQVHCFGIDATEPVKPNRLAPKAAAKKKVVPSKSAMKKAASKKAAPKGAPNRKASPKKKSRK